MRSPDRKLNAGHASMGFFKIDEGKSREETCMVENTNQKAHLVCLSVNQIHGPRNAVQATLLNRDDEITGGINAVVIRHVRVRVLTTRKFDIADVLDPAGGAAEHCA